MKQILKFLIIVLLLAGCKKEEEVKPTPDPMGKTCCEELGGKDSLFFAIQNISGESKSFRLFGGGTNIPLNDGSYINNTVTLKEDMSVWGTPYRYLISGNNAYITLYNGPGAGYIGVMDLTTATISSYIEISPYPVTEIALSGDYIYFGYASTGVSTDMVGVVQISTGTQIASIGLPAGAAGLSFFYTYNNVVYFNLRDTTTNDMSVYCIIPSVSPTTINFFASLGTISNGQVFAWSSYLGNFYIAITGSPNGRFVVMNAATGIISSSVSTASFTDSNSQMVQVGSSFYVSTGQNGSNTVLVFNLSGSITNTISTNGGPYGLAYVEGNIYVACYSDQVVNIIDPSTNNITGSISVLGGPYRISYINNYLYVTQLDNSSVSVIDISDNSIVDEIPTGGGPQLTFAQDPYTYLLSSYESKITILETASSPAVSMTANGGMTIAEINADTLANPICICALRLDGSSEAMYNTLLYKKRKDSNGLIHTESVDMREYLPAVQNANNNLVDIPGTRFESCVLDGFNYLEWEVPAGETVNVTIAYCQTSRSTAIGMRKGADQEMKWDEAKGKKRRFIHGSFKYVLK